MSAALPTESDSLPALRVEEADEPLLRPALDWFAARGWTPFEFQRRAWEAYLEGRDGLVHAPTGTGKTYAVWMGPLLEAAAEQRRGPRGAGKRKRSESDSLRVLWLTPLRALAGDTHHALCAAAEALGLNWSIELRTGDTSASVRSKQRQRLPTALITTPESLSLLLTYPDTAKELAGLRCVIVDEWHELMGTKRGVQTELCLARLRRLSPTMRTWGLSATLGNLDEAMRVLVGPAGSSGGREPVLVSADSRKATEVVTLIPEDIDRFPWAGHLGIRLLAAVVKQIESAATTLVFTNTRSQTEIWFQSIQRYRPELVGKVGLHHGSIDRDIRSRVEDHLRAGTLRCVVCTSSLDLGVDFQPVDQVIQIGSPKGVARLLQRAGRSGHQPGRVSRIVCVPTNALELVEFSAAEDAIAARALEARRPLRTALDVLVQHMVTLAAGCGEAGIDAREMFDEARSTHAFADLTEQQWQWCLDFVTRGGPALRAYPQYARLAPVPAGDALPKAPDSLGDSLSRGVGRLRVVSPPILRLHRLNVGTIMSDPSMTVRVSKSGRGEGVAVGTIEEGFVAKLRVGDAFAFAGRLLRLVRTRGMTAHTMPATRHSGQVASWMGARMSLSAQLAAAVRVKLGEAGRGEFRGGAMNAVAPLLNLQERWSRLPRPDELLIELTQTRGPGGGYHAFLYPLEGRLVHEGIAALLAFRIARLTPRSLTFSCNDFGLELVSPEPIDLDEAAWREVLSAQRLADDLVACLNATELSRRQFREVARIAGLIIPGFPGEQRKLRHLQASSEMFFDVFTQFDPENLLLDQARREVLDRQLEVSRLGESLERIAGVRLVLCRTPNLTPFSFPLWADSLREQVSSEKWSDRVKRMLVDLEEEADRTRDEAKPRKKKRRPWHGPAVRATHPDQT